ncbi:MAG: NADP-dependent oxidoreductase [Pseudomonadota bacterium]
MRAVVLTAHGTADNFVDMSLPEPAPNPGEVRVAVRATSFNPVDYQIRQGGHESKALRSMILGRDFSGIVVAVAEDVTDFCAGDEVFGYVADRASSGTYVEYLCAPAAMLAHKPKSLTHAQAAAVPVAGITACLALKKSGANRSKSMFVAGGAGGVGSFVILLARAMGITTLMTTAGSERSREYLRTVLGLKNGQILNHRSDQFIQTALEPVGVGYDVTVDLVGKGMLSACCRLLAMDGNLVSVTEAPSVEDFDILFDKNATFHTVGANAYALSSNRLHLQQYRTILANLAGQFDSGVLPPPPVQLLGELSADVVKQGHYLLQNGFVQGKIVMTVNSHLQAEMDA